MITITAMKWAPQFAAGNVRDHRVRCILNEVGWEYRVRLIDAADLASDEHRARQPVGQVPYLEETGRVALFESGAIVLDVATRAKMLLPQQEQERALAVTWLIAALNTVEPPLMNVAEAEYFIKDDAQKAARRPVVLKAAERRLEELQRALGDRQWLAGDNFTVADLMMPSVLKIARNLFLLERFTTLRGYQDRCFDRPAYRKAVDDQKADIASHTMADMKYELAEKQNGG